ncbi:unnamed protein product [Pelagomonas calceolata]|uniref:C-type lectin domain-containing protein n=1 Tax=Pelagomonas calceolata TaxID=35677 RepID=A0A8J2WZ42_9STRA|nr:unnamed protein product [Pelagomonas calceolata]
MAHGPWGSLSLVFAALSVCGALGGSCLFDFEDTAIDSCPSGWTCTGDARVVSRYTCVSGCGTPLPNAQGEQYFSIGGDGDTGTAQSPTFELPSDAQSLEFLRCGGADSPSGVSVHRESGSVVCSSSRGDDTDSFFWDSCDVSSADGERVYVRIVDTQSSSWGKVFVDNIRLDGGGDGCDDSGDSSGSNCDRSLCSSVADDCCAPLSIGEAATCRNGYVAQRTGNGCFGYGEGDYTCCSTSASDSNCAAASTGACLEGGGVDNDCCATCGNGGCASGYTYAGQVVIDSGTLSSTYPDFYPHCGTMYCGNTCCVPSSGGSEPDEGEAAPCNGGHDDAERILSCIKQFSASEWLGCTSDGRYECHCSNDDGVNYCCGSQNQAEAIAIWEQCLGEGGSSTTGFTITSSNVHWDECPGECAAIGGTFACISDESQNGQALAAFGGSCPDGADDCGAWIAVNDKASEGNWICTADGSTQTYQPWSAIGSEPNGGSGENCANMWGPNSGRNDGAWNDYGCTDARMPCICRGGGDDEDYSLTYYDDGSRQTYEWMKSSCATKGKRLCTYGEICPNGGPHQAPYGGQQASTDMWAPITPDAGEGGSRNQDWVQIGTRDGGMCNKHSSFYGGVHPDECCCGDWCNTNVQQVAKRIYACCDGEGGSSTTTTGTNCRSDICTDYAEDCCAPDDEPRGCSLAGYEVQDDWVGSSGWPSCVSTYGQESCASEYEWWDDRRLSAVDEPRRLGHCCDYGAYCSCMESELGAGCTAPDCGDWDEDEDCGSDATSGSDADVTCSLVINDEITAVYVDGQDVTDSLCGEWPATLRFSSAASLFAISGYDNQGGCQYGGFAMRCSTADGTGPWHGLTADTQNWRGTNWVSGSSWTQLGFDDSAWQTPSVGGEPQYGSELVGGGDTICVEGDFYFRREVDHPTPLESPFLVTGDLTFEGMTYEAALDNTNVFLAAVADLCGVAASAVTVEISRARRRRRLAEGIVVTYTVGVASANEAQTVTSAISSSSTADVDAAISKAATNAGVDDDFDGVTTTNVGTPTATASDDDGGSSSGKDDGPDAASAATIIASVAAAMCVVLIGVVGLLYWKTQQVQGRPVRPVGAVAVEMATYGQTMVAPSYVLKANSDEVWRDPAPRASAPPGRSFCIDCGAAIQGRF